MLNNNHNFSQVWAEIDLNAVAHNVRELRRITDHNAILMAVVKANAYGHGMIEIAQTALANGAEILGAARLEEGIKIRKAGINAPVLIFGHTPCVLAQKLFEFDLIQTVSSLDSAVQLSEIASLNKKKIRVHLKVDTGMGRLGVLPLGVLPLGILPLGILPDSNIFADQVFCNRALTDVKAMAMLPGLELEGIYTHFATADYKDKSFAKKQFKILIDFIDMLHKEGIDFKLKHAANSAAVIDMPETHLDMVRAGISIYGLYPSDHVDKTGIALKPAMSFKTRIVYLKKVPAGFKVSYGSTYTTKAPTTIATISAGYADGLNRLLSSNGRVLIRGSTAPIIGRICMDLTMVDVGQIPGVKINDEAVIFGVQGDASITVDEIALSLKTINYEVVSTITDRTERIYTGLKF